MWRARIASLHNYPVKSCGGTTWETILLQEHGVFGDRTWMVVDERDRYVTQRTHAVLATVPVAFDGRVLQLGPVADLPAVAVPVPSVTAVKRQVEVWRSQGTALDAGDAATEWFTRLLKQPARLVYAAPELFERTASADFAGDTRAPVAFSDGFPILVINSASLADLNQRMGAALRAGQFRPNIVLDALPAWAEDGIGRIDIGAVTLRLCKPCTRCIVPSIDQTTGLPGPNPTPTLMTFRLNRELRGVTFGENAVIERGIGATLSVGAEAMCWPR